MSHKKITAPRTIRRRILVLSCCAATLLAAGGAVWLRAQESVPTRSLPFSPARQAGPTLYVSGQVARTATDEEVRDSVAAETRQVMENLGRVLKENGYDWEDVVNATVYLKDIADYQEMNKVYASYFKNGFPARATVGGVELVFGFRVEISCVAYKQK